MTLINVRLLETHSPSLLIGFTVDKLQIYPQIACTSYRSIFILKFIKVHHGLMKSFSNLIFCLSLLQMHDY